MTAVKRLLFSLALLAALLISPVAAQRLVEWTQGPGELGLGYPVPMPMDTPLPFAGFRSYQSLHARHQDLMTTSAFLDGQVIGTTTSGGRNIWAYSLSDADSTTPEGLPEPAMMANGTTHAREWQSPEVLTGVMERFLEQSDDGWLYQYLLEHNQTVLLPVLNIDGLLQTQRFPTVSYLDSDGDSPRDGRMRRKNMRGVDEVIETTDDHLRGVDINRNNPPFWGSNIQNSSDSTSLVHRGSSAHSESENQALAAAALLGPEDRLRIYTDVHSFTQVNLSVNTLNTRRNRIQTLLLNDFTNFLRLIPGGRFYGQSASGGTSGIGSTDEYFAHTYQIPSWTLEIEPSGRGGLDYGGFGSNGHDGFILPESEISRVRDTLAQTFAVVWYHQSGPPSLAAVRVTDNLDGAVVFDAEWDVIADDQRQLHRNVIQDLTLDHDYTLWLAFDKPMRWQDDNGQVANLPGQLFFNSALDVTLELDQAVLAGEPTQFTFLELPGGAPDGYRRYFADAASGTLNLPTAGNESLISGSTEVILAVDTADMVAQELDAQPATVLDWDQGHWIRYEDNDGQQTDSGGIDRSIRIPFTDQQRTAPFLIEPGVSGAWFDPDHNGEGFLLEILDDQRAIIYWFTYDGLGNQRWFIGEGEIVANEIIFPDLIQTAGGRFGPDFDPDQVLRQSVGTASFLWRDCNQASMKHDIDAPRSRQQLDRLSQLLAIECGNLGTRTTGTSTASGSWFDPSHDGEGFVVQALAEDRVLVYWFTYDDLGNQAWILGDGFVSLDGTVTINEALITSGGRFGDEFDPDQVVLTPWGQIQFQFGCNSGSMNYQSLLPEFGDGSQALVRLSALPGLDCSP
jgi:hypothetical protein